MSADSKRDLVEIFETATYLICKNADVTKENFRKILISRNIPTKLFRAADKDKDGDLTLSEIMDLLVTLTQPTVSYTHLRAHET